MLTIRHLHEHRIAEDQFAHLGRLFSDVHHRFDAVMREISHLKHREVQMADQLDTVIERIRGQSSILAGVAEATRALKASSEAVRAQLVTLTEALGEAGNDNEQIAAINQALDAQDALVEGLRTELAPALTDNTPAEGQIGGPPTDAPVTEDTAAAEDDDAAEVGGEPADDEVLTGEEGDDEGDDESEV